MAAQVVQEAAGGGDGVGAAAEGLRGGAGRGPGQARYPRGGVDQRVAGFLDDAGAGRDVRAESGRVRGTAGLRGDVVQFPPFRGGVAVVRDQPERSEEHTSELQSRRDLVCRLLLEKKKQEETRMCAKQKKKRSRRPH